MRILSLLHLVCFCGVVVLAGCDDGTGATANSGGAGGSGAAGAAGGGGNTGGAGGAGGAGGGTTTSESTTSETTTSMTTSSTPTGCAGLGDPCTDCLATSCNAEYCACYDNPACAAMVQCSQGCAPGDASCAQTCFSNNSAGISQAALVGHCGATNCPSCTGTTALGACELCLFTSCSAQMNKCLANTACNQLIQCAQACPPNDDACQQGCALDNFGGVSDALDVQGCMDASCSGQCN